MLKAQICIFWYFLIVFELWIRFAWDEISLRSYWRLHGNGRFVFHACFQEVWQNWMALEPKRTNFDAKMRDFGVRLTFYSMHQIFLQVLEQDLRAVRSRHAAGRGPRTSKTNRMGCDKKIEQNLSNQWQILLKIIPNSFQNWKFIWIGYRAQPQSGGGKVPPRSFGCAWMKVRLEIIFSGIRFVGAYGV